MTLEITLYLAIALLALLIVGVIVAIVQAHQSDADLYQEAFDAGYIVGGDAEVPRWASLHDENCALYDRVDALKRELADLQEGYDFWKALGQAHLNQVYEGEAFRHVL
jgi:cell division protein FtsB